MQDEVTLLFYNPTSARDRPEAVVNMRQLLAETCRFAHVFQVHFGMAAA
jgi:hypothetical protein